MDDKEPRWYTYTWHWWCILGLHRWCPARWNDYSGFERSPATCNCNSEKWHKWLHTGTHDKAGKRLNPTPKPRKRRI